METLPCLPQKWQRGTDDCMEPIPFREEIYKEIEQLFFFFKGIDKQEHIIEGGIILHVIHTAGVSPLAGGKSELPSSKTSPGNGHTTGLDDGFRKGWFGSTELGENKLFMANAVL